MVIVAHVAILVNILHNLNILFERVFLFNQVVDFFQ